MFEKACEDPNYRENALVRLINIHLKEGVYLKAREELEKNQNDNNMKLKKLYGVLENIENNFETSKQYYNQCLEDDSTKDSAFLAMAKLNIQTGDNEIARKMLEKLQQKEKFNIQETISLICLNILEKNYKEAFKILEEIDKSKIICKQAKHYKTLRMYLLSFTNQLNSRYNCYDPNKNYMLYRLFDDSDDILLDHIAKHSKASHSRKNCRFLEDINLKELLYDARNRMEKMNSNHFELTDMYRFRLDYPIGSYEDKTTNDLCVSTIIGTKDIITMYPVLLSDEFDKEGMSSSKQLYLKRNNGITNKM